MPSEYQTAVITCAAVLGIKTVVVALATVRARIMSSTFNFKNPEATNLLGALFDKSGLLLTFINKGGSKQMVDIFERISLNNATNEPIFVARPGAEAEDDGWLLVLVNDGEAARTGLYVYDAREMEPVAIAWLNGVIPYGLHGTWADGEVFGAV